MLAELEEISTEQEEERKMPSVNHSYICNRILRQLFENEEIDAFPELTLDIEKGITPDICVYPKGKIQPNFRRDVTRYTEMPILAIEIISASQNIQDLLIKAEVLVNKGIKTVWTVEPFTNSIFVTTKNGEEKFDSRLIESNGINVDFKEIFGH